MKVANIHQFQWKIHKNLVFGQKDEKKDLRGQHLASCPPAACQKAPFFELPNTTCLQQMNLLCLFGIFRLEWKMSRKKQKIFKQVWLGGEFFSCLLDFVPFLGRLCWKSQLKRAVIATNKMSSFHQNISAKRHCSFNNKFYRIVCPAISEVLRGPISPPFQTLQDFWPRL